MRAWNNVCSSRLAPGLSLTLTPCVPCGHSVLLLLLLDVALDQSNHGGSSQQAAGTQAGKEGPGHSGGRRSSIALLIAFPRPL
jgi:hypothetical protein